MKQQRYPVVGVLHLGWTCQHQARSRRTPLSPKVDPAEPWLDADNDTAMQGEMRKSQDRCNQLQQELGISTAQHAALTAELAGAKQAVAAQQKRFESSQADKQALAHRVTEPAHFELDLSMAQSELTQLRNECESLRQQESDTANVTRQLAEKEGQITHLQTVVTQLKAELTQLKARLEQAKGNSTDRAKLASQVTQQEAEQTQLQQKLTEAVTELDSAHAELQSMQSRHLAQSADLSSLRAQLSESKTEASKLRCELNQAQSEASKKAAELCQVQSELQALQQCSQKSDAQTDTRAALSQEQDGVTRLQAEVARLQTDLTAAQKQASQQPQPQSSEQPMSHEAAVRTAWADFVDVKSDLVGGANRLDESASATSVVGTPHSSEQMSEAELRRMAETFRKSLGLEVQHCVCTRALTLSLYCKSFACVRKM